MSLMRVNQQKERGKERWKGGGRTGGRECEELLPLPTLTKARSRRKENPGRRQTGASCKSSHVHSTQQEKGVREPDTDPGEGRNSIQPADAHVLCHPRCGAVLQVGAPSGGDFLLGRGQLLLLLLLFLLSVFTFIAGWYSYLKTTNDSVPIWLRAQSREVIY